MGGCVGSRRGAQNWQLWEARVGFRSPEGDINLSRPIGAVLTLLWGRGKASLSVW